MVVLAGSFADMVTFLGGFVVALVRLPGEEGCANKKKRTFGGNECTNEDVMKSSFAALVVMSSWLSSCVVE